MFVHQGSLYYFPDERLAALTFKLSQIQRINQAVSVIQYLDKRLDDFEGYLKQEDRDTVRDNIKRVIEDTLQLRLTHIQTIYRRVNHG